MNNSAEPLLFLSHSGADTAAAAKLKRRILATPSAQEAGLKVWFDKDDLKAGREWQQQLEQALENATAFAVYVGSEGIVNWVEREVRFGLSRATGENAIQFIPILTPQAFGSSSLPPFARQFQAIRNPLDDDEELAKLIEAALSGVDQERDAQTDKPFIGLPAMDETWSDRFFGREKETDDVVDLLRNNNFVAIVAESGSGKSSLAQAGVVPAFRGGSLADLSREEPDERVWHVVVMRPGEDPFKNLRDAVTHTAEGLNISGEETSQLRKRITDNNPEETSHGIRCDLPINKTQTLLVVDQFEELLTQTPMEEREKFIDLLLELSRPNGTYNFRVLITMRSDYYNLCQDHEGLSIRLTERKDAVFFLRRMTQEGIVSIVKKPLHMVGGTNEQQQDSLVELIQNDVGERPGDLALIEFALSSVWRQRGGYNDNLVDTYVALGGVSGALATEADRVRLELSPEENSSLLLSVLMRIIQLGDTGGATRRIAQLNEFNDEQQELIKKLATDEGARLLLLGENSVEIAHEALITQWPWLQNQIGQKEPVHQVRSLHKLIEASKKWSDSDTKDKKNNLANAADVEEYSKLLAKRGDWLSVSEKQFVAASKKALDRANLMQKVLTYGSIAAAIILSVALYFLNDITNEAQKNEAKALQNQAAALAAIAKIEYDNDPQKATKLALAAWPRKKNDAKLPALPVAKQVFDLPSLADSHRLILSGHVGAILHLAWNARGTRIATASFDGTARIWDASTGKTIYTLSGHEETVNHLAWNGEGTRIATASDDGTARIWDASTGKTIHRLSGHEDSIYHLAWNAQGTRIATASFDGTARIWDASTGKTIHRLSGHEDSINHLAWNGEGTRIATASFDGTARIWDATTGKTIYTLSGHEYSIFHLAWNAQGTRIATASWDDTARIWDASTGETIYTLSGHEGSVIHLAWNEAGTRIATASSDNTARIWDATTGKTIYTLSGHEDPVYHLAWNAQGTRIATASWDDTARIWDATTGKTIYTLSGHEGSVNHLAWNEAGTRIATASSDNTARIWDATTGETIYSLSGHENSVTHLAWNGEGTRIATASRDDTARIWDAATGKTIHRLSGHEDSINHLAWNGEGTRIATASFDGTARIWDATTGKTIYTLSGHENSVTHLAWNGEGTRIATASRDDTARIWDAATGKIIYTLSGHEGSVIHLAWNEAGTRIATASQEGTVRIWDATTGETIYSLSGHENSVTHLAWNGEGTRIATASSDDTARIWDATTGKTIYTLSGHEGSVNHLAWNEAGTRIATASSDNTARIWDATTGETIYSLSGHENSVTHLAWNGEGTRIATASRDDTARIWDAATGKIIYTLSGHDSAIYHLAWNNEGTRIATASQEGTVRIWDVSGIPEGNAYEIACEWFQDHDTDELADEYGLTIEQPICNWEDGYDPPLTLPSEQSALESD